MPVCAKAVPCAGGERDALTERAERVAFTRVPAAGVKPEGNSVVSPRVTLAGSRGL